MTQAKITNVVCGMLATAAVSALSYQGACRGLRYEYTGAILHNL